MNKENLIDYISDISESYFQIRCDGNIAILNMSLKDINNLQDLVRKQFIYEMTETRECHIKFTSPFGQLIVLNTLSNGQIPVITPIK